MFRFDVLLGHAVVMAMVHLRLDAENDLFFLLSCLHHQVDTDAPDEVGTINRVDASDIQEFAIEHGTSDVDEITDTPRDSTSFPPHITPVFVVQVGHVVWSLDELCENSYVIRRIGRACTPDSETLAIDLGICDVVLANLVFDLDATDQRIDSSWRQNDVVIALHPPPSRPRENHF